MQNRVSVTVPIVNVNRAVGARIAGQVAKRYGNRGTYVREEGRQAGTRQTAIAGSSVGGVGSDAAPHLPPLGPTTGFKGELAIKFEGSAGQSFGAFTLDGMKVLLEGEANDYVGKGMNGGSITIVPAKAFAQRPDVDPSENVRKRSHHTQHPAVPA